MFTFIVEGSTVQVQYHGTDNSVFQQPLRLVPVVREQFHLYSTDTDATRNDYRNFQHVPDHEAVLDFSQPDPNVVTLEPLILRPMLAVPPIRAVDKRIVLTWFQEFADNVGVEMSTVRVRYDGFYYAYQVLAGDGELLAESSWQVMEGVPRFAEAMHHYPWHPY